MFYPFGHFQYRSRAAGVVVGAMMHLVFFCSIGKQAVAIFSIPQVIVVGANDGSVRSAVVNICRQVISGSFRLFYSYFQVQRYAAFLPCPALGLFYILLVG